MPDFLNSSSFVYNIKKWLVLISVSCVLRLIYLIVNDVFDIVEVLIWPSTEKAADCFENSRLPSPVFTS